MTGDQFEKDTAKEVDDLYIKLGDGWVVEKVKRCFVYRKGTLMDGRPAVKDIRDKVYTVADDGSFHNLHPKLGKAAKKAMKRQRVAGRKAANGAH